MPIRLQAYTFVVAASLSSTYFRVRLRHLLAAARGTRPKAGSSILNANRHYPTGRHLNLNADGQGLTVKL
jgi:hypothetical protein